MTRRVIGFVPLVLPQRSGGMGHMAQPRVLPERSEGRTIELTCCGRITTKLCKHDNPLINHKTSIAAQPPQSGAAIGYMF